MTTSNPASSASDRTDAQYARLRRRAIDALTQAARLSWPAHTVTAAGTERHMPQSRMDAADLIVDVVTATAANLGGIDELLAGRTGSWEAALVRQMLEGATGGDEAVLAEYRTDPITVEVDPYLLLKDTGVLDRWEEQERSAIGAVISSTGPMAVFDGEVDDQIADLEEHFSRRRREVLAGYTDQLTAQIEKAARDRGYTVPVEVKIVDFGPGTQGPLERSLVEAAAGRVDLPGQL